MNYLCATRRGRRLRRESDGSGRAAKLPKGVKRGVEKINIKYWEYGAIQAPVTRTVEEVIDGMKGYWIPEMEEPKK